MENIPQIAEEVQQEHFLRSEEYEVDEGMAYDEWNDRQLETEIEQESL